MNKGVKYFGIHAFLASNTITNDYYTKLAKELFNLAIELKKETNANITFINLSGGVGIAYKPEQMPNDISVIGENVHKIYEEILVPEGMGNISIYTEMGRFMLAPYGALITKGNGKYIHIYRNGQIYVSTIWCFNYKSNS